MPYLWWKSGERFTDGRKNWDEFMEAAEEIFRILQKVSGEEVTGLSEEQRKKIMKSFKGIQSDDIIRNLRKKGDTNHYLPKGGMFRFVTSANYFGEVVEWTGFAILTWSWAGAVFALWTFANLTPRAARIYNRYRQEFPDQLDTGRTKRMIPFIF